MTHYYPWYNKDADYQTNAKSYMDYLARTNQFMKVLVEDYEVFKELILEEFKDFQHNTSRTIDQFNARLNNIQQEMTDLFVEWANDGTLDHIINDTILGWKMDRDEALEKFEELDLKKVTKRDTFVYIMDFNLTYASKCALVVVGGQSILIDTGDRNHSLEAITKIRNRGIQQLDKVIISHYHLDHSGGVPNFVDAGLIGTDTDVILPPTPNWNLMASIGSGGTSAANDWRNNETTVFNTLTQAGVPYRLPNEKVWESLGDEIGIRFHNTLPTYFEAYYNDLTRDYVAADGVYYNNFSLVTEIKNGAKHFVFTGDLGLQAQKQLRHTFDDPIYFYDIEHHGINYAYDEGFFKQINPKYAVIQNANRTFPYYSRGTYGYFKALGTQLFITGVNGDLLFHDHVDGMRINTARKNGTAETGRLHHYMLTGGYTVIQKGMHLDDLTEAGIYVARTLSDVSGISGLPSNSREQVTAGFKLVVETYHDTSRIRQTLYENTGRGFVWYRTFSTNNQWNPWFRLARSSELFHSNIGTPLEPGTDLNQITVSGKYSAPTNAIAETIVNKPDEVRENFTIEIYPMHDPTRFYQHLKVINERNDEYTRVYSNTGYHRWNKINKTLLT